MITEIQYLQHKFTFHYVSINSLHLSLQGLNSVQFTFHYVSINSMFHQQGCQMCMYLHSTMYLLILYYLLFFVFLLCHLYSTMYLLIHDGPLPIHVTFLYLHSTMYLLILIPTVSAMTCKPKFTFHYVSINS